MKDGNHLIETGSVTQIIEKLFDEFYSDPSYSEVIFLTHPYFMTSTELLKIIRKKYVLL